MTLEEILDAATLVGYHLLCNGADISRVEQSINYICSAYDIAEINAFAIPSSIVVTISDGKTSITKTRRIREQQTNLDRVEKLAGLSRYICAENPEYKEIEQRVNEILDLPAWALHWQYAAYMLSGLSFSLFFGGSILDGILSACIGALIMFLKRFLGGLGANGFFINIVCSFASAFIGSRTAFLLPLLHPDKITIGSIMLLVPGLAIANAMRDFITSDTVTGLSRITEAIFVAAGVAIGVACAMMV